MNLKTTLSLLFLSLGLAVQTGVRAETPLEAALNQSILEDRDANRTDGVFFGIFRPTLVTDIVEQAPADLRFKPASLMWFWRFGSEFPETALLFLKKHDMVAHMAWEPWTPYGEAIPLADIIAGKWDPYIDEFARNAARVDLPLVLRFAHEMNGNWYPWAVSTNGQDAKLYIEAFRHVVQRFRQAGANKVQFVWCINNESVPQADWNALAATYPGDEYVDWLGIDGYNFGTSAKDSRWKSFEETFRPAYDAIVQRAPNKPILIGEMSSSEAGGNKAAWIREMYRVLPSMPNIRAITWFDTLKETSWNIDSSDEAWIAMLEGLRLPWMRGNGEAMAKVAKPAR